MIPGYGYSAPGLRLRRLQAKGTPDGLQQVLLVNRFLKTGYGSGLGCTSAYLHIVSSRNDDNRE